MSASRGKAGRPQTRSREVFMLAIWRKVREQIWYHGAPNVKQACDQIFSDADGLLKFSDAASGQVLDVIVGELTGANTLRQRYYHAERCRRDPSRYPLLASRCAQLEQAHANAMRTH